MKVLRTMRGFSTTEMAVLISAVSLIGAVARPAIEDYVNQARLVRASQDAHAISVAFLRFSDDVTGQARVNGGWATYGVLTSDGTLPGLGQGGDPRWLAPAGDRSVGSLTAHLVTNDAKYRRFADQPAAFGWRGPYIENSIGSDPWGHRYAVNVQSLMAGGGLDTMVISAGPNGLIETTFEGDGLVAGGDDVVALVSSGG